jgi:tRNA(Ile)-lysidine synthase
MRRGPLKTAQTTSAAASGALEVTDAEQPFRDDELDRLFAPLEPYQVVLLAVSGGVDSTALMHLVSRWHSRRGQSGPLIAVATVDHALRPSSAAEAAAVGVAATALGFPHHIRRWDGPKPTTGLQAAARDVRYRLLDDVLRGLVAKAPRRDLKHQARGAVITAHTADDQAETFIMRLARGSGADGLAAMAPTALRVIEQDPRLQKTLEIVRPLLGVARARLLATLKAEGVHFVDDPSNADTRFERVRVRQALETLEALGVTREAIARSAERLRSTRELLERTSFELLAKAMTHPFGLYMTLNDKAFRAADPETGLRAFRLVLAQMGGAHPPSRLTTVEAAFTRLFRRPASEATPVLTLNGCIVEPQPGAILHRVVHVYREEHRHGGLETVRLLPGEDIHWDRRFLVRAKPGWRSSVTVGPLGDDWAILKESVPELKDLLPVRAARTMPCVRTSDGRFACPGLMDAARQLRGANPAVSDALPPGTLEALERAALGTLTAPGRQAIELLPADVTIAPGCDGAIGDHDDLQEF